MPAIATRSTPLWRRAPRCRTTAPSATSKSGSIARSSPPTGTWTSSRSPTTGAPSWSSTRTRPGARCEPRGSSASTGTRSLGSRPARRDRIWRGLARRRPAMTKPFVLVQLSDPHIGAEWGGPDAVGRLAAAVGTVRALPQQPDAILVSGDLADNATDAEYGQLQDLLRLIEAPSYVLPGNHDDRDALYRNFGVPGAGGEPVQYAADLGALRLVVLDTTQHRRSHA